MQLEMKIEEIKMKKRKKKENPLIESLAEKNELEKKKKLKRKRNEKWLIWK